MLLVRDACGRPSMPARPQGLAVGYKARKLPAKITAEIEKAKKRAKAAPKRRGECAAEVEAAVLRQPANIATVGSTQPVTRSRRPSPPPPRSAHASSLTIHVWSMAAADHRAAHELRMAHGVISVL